jgi:cellulose synthase/poly-beta-1,6-N-acetylglucosamine synthase-like glycosyltransferase
MSPISHLPSLLFFGCLAVIVYVYAGYPLMVFLLARLTGKDVRRGPYFPSVSIIIPAYNEEKCIEATIRNKLGLDYPKERMEVIVVSDGSTDGTDDIVSKYAGERVHLLRQEKRAGKTAALNEAVSRAKGDVIVFSDANSLYAPDAVGKLVRNFHDARVGYVTGKMVYTSADGEVIGKGCSAYMRYENFIWTNETRIGSIVGADGGIDAMRKHLYCPMKPDQLPDFVQPLRVVEQGWRVVYEPEALLKEPALDSAGDEYAMRVRVSLRALWALLDMRCLLDFSSFGTFSWQLWSHKVLRYLCPLFLLGAYTGNLLLLRHGIVYQFFFLLQNSCYAAVLLSAVLHRKLSGILYLLNYFVLLNAASFHAFLQFVAGRKKVVWTPRKG